MKGVLLRWWQPRHNGTGHDQWALDHVEVVLWVSASPHPTPSQKALKFLQHGTSVKLSKNHCGPGETFENQSLLMLCPDCNCQWLRQPWNKWHSRGMCCASWKNAGGKVGLYHHQVLVWSCNAAMTVKKILCWDVRKDILVQRCAALWGWFISFQRYKRICCIALCTK